MHKLLGLTCALLLLLGAYALAAPATTKAAFAVNGLHWAACAGTLETSLRELDGVKSAQVNFQSKQAMVEFDESQVAASKVAQQMAATPHMMGRDMKYGGALLLRSDRLRSRNHATALQNALSKVEGVSKATADTRSQTVAVEFAGKGEVKTTDLIEAGRRAGQNLTVASSPVAGAGGRSSRRGGWW